jgi:hypothetical protein
MDALPDNEPQAFRSGTGDIVRLIAARQPEP